MTDQREALTTASKTLAKTMTSVSSLRRWLIIASVSILLVAFLLTSPLALGEYAQEILAGILFRGSHHGRSAVGYTAS
jgi:hypothetical protein